MNKPGAREGFFATLQSIGVALLTMLQTRVELLGNELEIQKLTALRMLLIALAMVFCAGVGVLLLSALVALLFWDQRVAVLAIFAAVFVFAAVLLYRALMRIVRDPQPAFAATLAELKEDMRRLKAASTHATTPD